jgi:gliding motility-associated-like protein
MKLYFQTVFIAFIFFQSAYGQVVINEVMNKPATANNVNQGMVKKEYVEIYNNSCSPIDISCWILGSSAPLTGSTPYWVGAFRFPAGTTINPGQHMVIGGTQSDNGTPYPAADIDFILGGNPNMCQAGTGGWLLPNGDGWVGLFDASGAVRDAIYWSLNTNPNIMTDLDYSTAPCLPTTSCGTSPTLPSAQQIYSANNAAITYVGLTNPFDRTFSRIPDGGAWQRDVAPSILGPNNCNNGICNTTTTIYANAQITQPGCGANDGSITLQPSPSGTYNYSWVPNVSSSATASNLAPGTYTITISTASGCSIDTTITLASSGGLNNVTFTTSDASCNAADGSITVSNVNGGNPAYTYSLDGVTFVGSNQFLNLNAGNYTLYVQDANNCSLDTNFVIHSPNAPTDIQATILNASCNQNDGSIQITNVIGGTAAYTYSLDNITFSATNLFSNLSAGNYTIYVNDQNGCSYNEALVVASASGPNNATIQVQAATCGLDNGSITVSNIVGGTAPYQINFNNTGYAAQTAFQNLASGNYSLSIQDDNGCIFNLPNQTVLDLDGPNQITFTPFSTTCALNNGSVDVSNVLGGTQPYSFSLSNGSINGTGDFSNLPATAYTLTVTDQNNCVLDTSFTVAASTGPTDLDLIITNAICDQNNGQIEVNNVLNGTAPFTFNLSNGSSNTNGTFSGLAAGNYSIEVIDANGCSITESANIQGGTSPIADFSFSPSTISSIGEQTVQMINSSSPSNLTYEWYFEAGFPFTSNMENPSTAYSGLNAGNYSITLIATNPEGCTDTLVKYIEVKDDILIYVPNSFTPDGDEFNNIWQPIIGFADMASYDLFIFNRWGEIVFESHDPIIGWDGTYLGKMVPDGTYTWTIQLKDPNNDFKKTVNGHLSILR